ncbi:GTPase IMAP family member 8 [Pangasianodon hypophthalmus]|uniref:GTPase IMAP family member 8 n=1 Tax=Pangasianodon hypophthalmus TaxID=310915 RepID=UPI00230723AA|nr:GTPase IMAP family member 8 [Pangasianodon hypophthalmus]XP_053094602.1 GTPase IMAP family member 8 [Pangasianodon hypophthalmus]
MTTQKMASTGDPPQESECRIILIGPSEADMASTGNTILGRDMFGSRKSSKCIKRDGEIAGRKITLVVTPNRWSSLPPIDTTERDKQEIMLSMLLCDPGPHAILLVIGEEKITKDITQSMEEHTELLGHEVWDHTILLYSYGNQHEECVRSAGEAFEQLAHKCGNRYHVLNNRNSGDSIQVIELLKKIDDMLQENKGNHCEIDRKIYLLQKWREEEDKRAEQRLLTTQNQRKMLRSKIGSTSHISEIRILLTGYQYSGKSSTGNTILAEKAFPLKRITKCVKSQGDVQGRHLTIVDTPGRWRIHQVKFTSEFFKQDIVLSATQCPPGPHILLVLVRLATSFTENNRRAMEGHLQLFGDNVWRYTMVLFTCGDFLGETTIEQFIESEGEALQWLVQKCNNRYHVFNNKREDDRFQVSELLEKIDEVVASNGGGHFEVDQMILQEVQKKRKVAEEQARKRRLKAQEEQKGGKIASCSDSKKSDKLLMRASLSVPDLNIVLIGFERAGKTTVGNIILGKNIFPKRKTLQSVQQHGLVAGRQVVVVDTPGWDWENVLKKTPVLDWQIVQSVQTPCSKVAPVVFLLVVRAALSFKEVNKRTTEEYLQLLGDCVWSHTIVLFTTGGWMEDIDIEQHIESEGDALQWLVEKCGNRYHVLDTTGKKEDVQVPELMRKIEQLVANNKDCPFQLDKKICETVERKYSIVSNQTSQRMLKDSKKYGSMIWPPPNMCDDDQSSGYSSFQSLPGTSSTPSLRYNPTEMGQAQGIHFSKSRTLGDLCIPARSKADPDTTSLKSIRERAKEKRLKTESLK